MTTSIEKLERLEKDLKRCCREDDLHEIEEEKDEKARLAALALACITQTRDPNDRPAVEMTEISAIEYYDGSKDWYKNGKLIATQRKNEDKVYVRNGD